MAPLRRHLNPVSRRRSCLMDSGYPQIFWPNSWCLKGHKTGRQHFETAFSYSTFGGHFLSDQIRHWRVKTIRNDPECRLHFQRRQNANRQALKGFSDSTRFRHSGVKTAFFSTFEGQKHPTTRHSRVVFSFTVDIRGSELASYSTFGGRFLSANPCQIKTCDPPSICYSSFCSLRNVPTTTCLVVLFFERI